MTDAQREEAERTARAASLLDEAQQAALEHGRAVVAEARAVRRRMLEDVERRRRELIAELEKLRASIDDTITALRAGASDDAVSSATPSTPRRRATPRPEPAVRPVKPLRTTEPAPATDTPPTAGAGTTQQPEPLIGADDAPTLPPRVAALFDQLRGEPPKTAEPPKPRKKRVADAAPARSPAAARERRPAGTTAETRGTAEKPAIEKPATDESTAETTAATPPPSTPSADRGADEPAPASGDASTPEPDEATTPAAADAGGREAEAAASSTVATVAETTPEATVLRRRDVLLDTLVPDVMRSSKRLLQDEQNTLLDAVRRARGKPEADRLMPEPLRQREAWSALLARAFTAAYLEGRAATGKVGRVTRAPDRVVIELTAALVTPLRERVMATIDAVVAEGPYESVVELQRALGSAIGARYREWRSAELEKRVVDVLCAAYARGAYESAGPAATLQWVPDEPGKCPDCDDNALEATLKGKPFPTGQTHPPAHPGCRCVAVPADALT